MFNTIRNRTQLIRHRIKEREKNTVRERVKKIELTFKVLMCSVTSAWCPRYSGFEST